MGKISAREVVWREIQEVAYDKMRESLVQGGIESAALLEAWVEALHHIGMMVEAMREEKECDALEKAWKRLLLLREEERVWGWRIEGGSGVVYTVQLYDADNPDYESPYFKEGNLPLAIMLAVDWAQGQGEGE